MAAVSIQSIIALVVCLLVFYLVGRNLYWIIFNIMRREYEKQDIYHLMEIAESELKKGHLFKAKIIVKGILKQKDSEVGARVLLAKILRAQRKNSDAETILIEIMNNYPNYSIAQKELDSLRSGT